MRKLLIILFIVLFTVKDKTYEKYIVGNSES